MEKPLCMQIKLRRACKKLLMKQNIDGKANYLQYEKQYYTKALNKSLDNALSKNSDKYI